MNCFIKYFICVTLLFAGTAQAFTVEKQLEDVALEKQARAIFKEVRCVVCDGQSIGDSEAEIAKDLRLFIRNKLTSGSSASQIKEILAQKYGRHILFAPALEISNYILWFAPISLLIIGFLLIFRVRKSEK